MNKLTLSIDKKTVQHAKKIAAANGLSVSGMFRLFVRSMPADHKMAGGVKKSRGKR